MANLALTRDFRNWKQIDNEFWGALVPYFANYQSPFPNWWEATNHEGKSLLLLATEFARCPEMEVFLKIIRNEHITVRPGSTTYNNIVWVSIACVKATGGVDFLKCLLRFPEFVRQHAFAIIENERGQSPVHLAALNGTLELFKTLEGFDRTGLVERLKRCVSRDVETPLDLALHTGRVDMIDLLMSLYTLPASRDNQGKPKENILHRALKAQTPNLDVVQIILKRNPSLLTDPDRDDKTPLRFITGRQDTNVASVAKQNGKQAVQLIKEFLISCLIESDIGYEELRRELGSEVQGKELYFNVEFLSQPVESFQSYLKNLTTLEISFHNTLKSVKLPDLQCSEYDGIHPTQGLVIPGQPSPRPPCSGKYGVRSTYEVLEVFNFLRHRKVDRVKSVKVLDCLVHPHSNLIIKACLKDLDVRKLDWRKRDLSLHMVNKVAPNVTELHLYSSGNEDVLHFWEETGIPKLKEMKKLFITISQHEFDPTDKDGIEKFREKWEKAFNKKILHTEVIMEPLPKAQISAAVSGLQRSLSKAGAGKTVFTEMENILGFIRDISSDDEQIQTQSARENPIKVAILDSGLSLYDLHLPALIHQPVGRSFVEDTRLGSDTHWHSPQASHGNKLAQIILRCNPHCKLYIAKVQSGPNASSIEISAAIKALEWVAEEKVDVICMSWTINEASMEQELRYKFEDAIDRAAALTFCSLSDEGRFPTSGSSYPAAFKKCNKISSYSPAHPGVNDSEHHSEAFYFPADDLDVHPLPDYFGDGSSQTTVEPVFKGSSYATALAAGMAAFVLQCVQYAYHPGSGSGVERPKKVNDVIFDFKRVKMERLFMSMCDPGEAKHFVKPWMAFNKHDWTLATESDDDRLAVLRTLLS